MTKTMSQDTASGERIFRLLSCSGYRIDAQSLTVNFNLMPLFPKTWNIDWPHRLLPIAAKEYLKAQDPDGILDKIISIGHTAPLH